MQELCEMFGAGFLHRKKVRAVQTVSGSEWLSELYHYLSLWLHLQEDCQPVTVHEVAVSAEW